MADYEARRNDDGPTEHDHQNAKNTARTAAKGAATYFGGSAGGKAVDIASKTKLGDKILDKAAKPIENNKALRNINNKLNDSGAMKAAETAIDSASGGSGGAAGNAAGKAAGSGGKLPNETPNQVKNKNNMGGGQDSSLPSSSSNKNMPGEKQKSSDDDYARKNGGQKTSKSSDEGSDSEKKDDGLGNFLIKGPLKMILLTSLPGVIVFFFTIIIALTVVGFFSDYEDAIGISSTTGDETGGVVFNASTPEQQAYYDRVNSVKTSYQANGKTVDALKVVAVFHVLKYNGADIDYKDISDSDIREVADSMFSGNSYSEDTFKNNLIYTIIPKYLPDSTQSEREKIADDVFDYVERYNDLIGKNKNTGCSGSGGSCDYDIKGFYINGWGNVTKEMKVSNLKVRLMECGGRLGNGTDGKPIDGEDLINFEDYVAGVTYAEVGDYGDENYIKAEMVAARSYALARPTAMGGAHNKKLEEEDGQWILQIAACVSDQAFCNIDKGCSWMGGGDGQGGFSRSGTVAGAYRTRPPAAEDSPIRTYAKETEGEVLVNSQGYIIHASYLSTLQNKWESLSKSGLNYKQILLQTYNQGSYNFGAADIYKASCGGGSSGVCTQTTGEYASWKQYEGEWVDVPMGNSGKTIKQIGCLATSIAIQIARSGVSTNVEGTFNPGTFVQYLNNHGGFADGGNFVWASAESVAPEFKHAGDQGVSGWGRQDKLNKIKEITSEDGVYAVAEVKGNTGQHWVAIDKVEGDTIKMMDPGSSSTDMWAEYNWANTSRIVWWKVG